MREREIKPSYLITRAAIVGAFWIAVAAEDVTRAVPTAPEQSTAPDFAALKINQARSRVETAKL